MECDDEGVLDLFEDVHFCNHEFGLFAEDDFLLREGLQSIEFFIFETLYQKHLPKGPLS